MIEITSTYTIAHQNQFEVYKGNGNQKESQALEAKPFRYGKYISLHIATYSLFTSRSLYITGLVWYLNGKTVSDNQMF